MTPSGPLQVADLWRVAEACHAVNRGQAPRPAWMTARFLGYVLFCWAAYLRPA